MWFMAMDQHGKTYHGLVKPRRDLLKRLGRKHADLMYQDMKDGSVAHVGYIIAGLWLTVYEVKPMTRRAK